MTGKSLRYVALAFIGFANALPMMLTGSTLSIWLAESGFQKDTIGLFALLGLPFSLKILWTPILDHSPYFFGRERKSWLILSIIAISLVLFGLSFVQPTETFWKLVALLLVLPLFTGCLYIVGINYELESLEEGSYGMGSASVLTGYRMGLLCGGAGALYLSAIWDWAWMFRLMSLSLLAGSFIIMFLTEPYKSQAVLAEKRKRSAHYGSLFQGWWNEIILQPCRSFMGRADWQVVLVLIVGFKIGDQLLKSMQGPFYLSLGFDKAQIAIASNFCGMVTTIAGAFLGGLFIRGKDPAVWLVTAGLIHACTLLNFLFLVTLGNVLWVLCCTVAIENFTGGMAMTIFISYLWRVCDKRYAAVQYALLWSLYYLKSDLLSCLGGILAAECTWKTFFSVVGTIGIGSSLILFRSCLPLLQPAQKYS